MQQRATFVVKKKFVPFDHLVVCCCIMLHVVVSCCMKFARGQKCLWNKCCAIEHFFCFQRCCMLLLSFDHLRKLCCVLISRNYRLNPLFTFSLYLSGFKSSSVKQNLRIAIQLPLICRSSRMCCKMTQNIIY